MYLLPIPLKTGQILVIYFDPHLDRVNLQNLYTLYLYWKTFKACKALFSWLYSIGVLTDPWEFKLISFHLWILVHLEWICSGSTEDLVKVECQLWMMGDFHCTHSWCVWHIQKMCIIKKKKIKSKESNGSYQFKRRVGRGKEEILIFSSLEISFGKGRKSNHGSLLFTSPNVHSSHQC